jgi:hypothetical protein
VIYIDFSLALLVFLFLNKLGIIAISPNVLSLSTLDNNTTTFSFVSLSKIPLLYRYFCSSTTGDVWFCWRRMILPLSEEFQELAPSPLTFSALIVQFDIA